MNRPRFTISTLAPTLLILALVTQAGPAYGLPDGTLDRRTSQLIQRLEKQIESPNWQRVVDAVEELRRLDEYGRRPLARALVQRLEHLRRERETTESFLTSTLLWRSNPKYREPVDNAFALHNESSTAFMSRAFDDSRYPVPAKASTGWRPGIDAQKGQRQIEASAIRCFQTYAHLEWVICSAMGKKAKKQSRFGGEGLLRFLDGHAAAKDKPLQVQRYQMPRNDKIWGKFFESLHTKSRKRTELLRREAQVRLWLCEEGDGHDSQTESDALTDALWAVAAEDYELAAEHYENCEELDRALFGFLMRQYTLQVSRRLIDFHDWDEVSALTVDTTNIYRVCTGLWPLLPNLKLRACAKEHAQYQKKTRQMSHHRSQPEMATPLLRARQQGYTGSLCENIAGRGSAQAGAFWSWRTDAGHHRNLIRKASRGVGLAMATGRLYPTWNAGPLAEHPVEAIMIDD